jgi:hypothetical protein
VSGLDNSQSITNEAALAGSKVPTEQHPDPELARKLEHAKDEDSDD